MVSFYSCSPFKTISHSCDISFTSLSVLLTLSQRTNNATIEVIIEDGNFNNSLAGALNCPNAYPKSTGKDARDKWRDTYLKDGKSSLQWKRPTPLGLP